MQQKRVRIFAGPNGSGKTTTLKKILESNKIRLGVYVNADEIENELKKNGCISFEKFNLKPDISKVQTWFKVSLFSPIKRLEKDLWEKISMDQNTLVCQTSIDSYLAADLAEFIRCQLLEQDQSFTFETVLSHPDKVTFMQKAKEKNYKVYMYYISTEDPEININRVSIRIRQDGHPVEPEIVRKRYFKSLGLLKSAVKNTHRTYIFDNSGKQAVFIAEISEGNRVMRNENENPPAWVEKYLFE